MTDQTPSQKPGLRDQLVNALGQIDTTPPIAHRRAQADNVLAVLYREWPWLRAAAEESGPAPGRKTASTINDTELDQLYAENDRLRALLDAEQRTLAEVDQRCDRYAAELAALRVVSRGYCPECGRGDAAPTVADWEQQRQRADEAEQRLRRIADGHPRADAIQAEIGEMIAQTHELREQLARAETELRRYTEAESADAAAGSYAGRAEQAEAALARVHEIADLIQAPAAWTGNLDNIAVMVRQAATVWETPGTSAAHVYLSTGCFHGDHDYCKAMTGLNGAKRPASCKKCGAKCVCGCHGAEETATPAEPDDTELTEADVDRMMADSMPVQLAPAPPEPGLYDKLTGMFSGPLPSPTDVPPTTVLPCSHAQLRQAHDPHPWQPQPGMRHVQCPGYAPVPAATEATDGSCSAAAPETEPNTKEH